MYTSHTLAKTINAAPENVYAFAHNPSNLAQWAPGFVKSIANHDGQWVAETTIGKVTVRFAPANDLGVLDHEITQPSGEVVYVPMRVIANGSGSEVLFTLFHSNTAADSDFERDMQTVQGDLEKLRILIEAEQGPD